MHGKNVSCFHHRGTSVVQGLPNPQNATRYHSLVVADTTLPNCLEIMAWTEHQAGEQDEIMGLQHTCLPIEGVQFHPESILILILTDAGHALLANFLTR